MNDKGVSLTITTIAVLVVLLILFAFLFPSVFNRIRSYSGYLGSIEDRSSKYCFQIAEELNKKYEESKKKEQQHIRYQSLNVIKDEECAAQAKEKSKEVGKDKGLREDDYYVFTSRDTEEDGSLCCLYRQDEGITEKEVLDFRCVNNKKDGDEMYVDCGGSCSKCECVYDSSLDNLIYFKDDKKTACSFDDGWICDDGTGWKVAKEFQGNDLADALKNKPENLGKTYFVEIFCKDKLLKPEDYLQTGLAHCFNDETGDETDTNCGGSCEKCSIGKKCKEDSDCQSSYCSNNKICSEPTCNDQEQNQDETYVDCGGVCVDQGKKCELNQHCLENSDCETGNCLTSNVCGSNLCTNSQRDANEEYPDCGGDCNECQCTFDTFRNYIVLKYNNYNLRCNFQVESSKLTWICNEGEGWVKSDKINQTHYKGFTNNLSNHNEDFGKAYFIYWCDQNNLIITPQSIKNDETYRSKYHCFNGIKDSGEEGKDCGGPCPAC